MGWLTRSPAPKHTMFDARSKTMQESQASLIDAMKNMSAELTRSNAQSESGGIEGSATVGESPAGAGPAQDAGMEPI